MTRWFNRQRFDPGSPWTGGPVAWADGNEPGGPEPGYYPVTPDGPDLEVRLRWVDDAPDDDDDGAGHFEAFPQGEPYEHGATFEGATINRSELRRVRRGDRIELSVRTRGTGTVNTG